MNDLIRHGMAAATPLLDWPWLEHQWWFIGALLVGGLVLWEIASQLDREG